MKAKRIIAAVMAVMLAAALLAPAAMADGNTVHITTAEQFRSFAKKCTLDSYSEGLTVELDADIDLGDGEFYPVPTFSGVFKGNGHVISGLSLATDGSHQGLFRYVQTSGVVQNLTVTGHVQPGGSRHDVGGIVGTNYGTVRNCTFSGTVSGLEDVGGVAGENFGSVRGCKATGSVTGKRFTGGIVGCNSGILSGCENRAGVNTTISETELELGNLSVSGITGIDIVSANDTDIVSDSGGIVGASDGTVSVCINYGTVGYPHYGYNVGGIAGRQSGYMFDCRNFGQVYGRQDVGGIAGQMEPYLELEDSGSLAVELDELHELVNTALYHSGGQTGELTAALDKIKDNAASAAGNAGSIAAEVGSFADNTVDSTNELLERLDYAVNELQPAIHDLSTAMQYLNSGIVHLDNAMDEMELDEETKAEIRVHLDELSAAMERMNVELDYLAYVSSAYFNRRADGDVDLEQMKPDNWEQVQQEYGYDYTLTDDNANSKLRKAMLKAASDLIADASKANRARTAILDILDAYYLTPVYDTDEDGEPDQSRLDYSADEGSMARDDFVNSSAYFSTALEQIDSVNTYLASLDQVQYSKLSTEYYTATDNLLANLNQMAGNMSELNASVNQSSDVLTYDLVKVNDQLNRVLGMMANALNGRMEVNIFEDISEENISDSTDGKVFRCVNNGAVDGDVNVGGIAGAMGMEYEYDMEGDIASTLGAEGIFSNTYKSRCVIDSCVNKGSILGRKDNIGGAAGVSELGTIVGAEGYGNVAGEGNYVGGIVGYSYTTVRDSYAMCNVSGSEYVGGIAGYGTCITGCSSLIGASDVTACCGAVAGWADVTEEDAVSGNFYVHENLGAIDGISYAGKAEPVTYEQLLEIEGVPRQFRELKLSYVADGEVVQELKFTYGGTIDTSRIPEVPEKAGYTGSWPEYDYSTLYFSDTIEAVYKSRQATMAASNVRENSPMAVVLVEGDFADGARVLLNEYAGEGPGAENTKELEKWVLRLDNTGSMEEGYSVRYLIPELSRSGSKVDIYTYADGVWTPVQTKTSGSYTVFDSTGDMVVFCAVETQNKMPTVIACAAAGTAALAGAGIFTGKAIKKKKTSVPAEQK